MDKYVVNAADPAQPETESLNQTDEIVEPNISRTGNDFFAAVCVDSLRRPAFVLLKRVIIASISAARLITRSSGAMNCRALSIFNYRYGIGA